MSGQAEPASYRWENRLIRAGFLGVAGADEAGRGACAGPLVAAAVILPPVGRRRPAGLLDSKLLSAAAREKAYAEITARALTWSVVSLSPRECDRLGMHEANLQALRRALLRLSPAPAYALTDGFPVPGLAFPALAVWKGDQVAACVAAASIIAKVTRDRLMDELDDDYPGYGFAVHKGYCTSGHQRLLDERGPSPAHRWCYVNVRRAARLRTP